MSRVSDEDIDHIAFLLNSKADKFLPKLHELHTSWELLQEFKQEAQEKLGKAMAELDVINKQYIGKDTFNTHNHRLTKLKEEFDFHRKHYSQDKYEKLNEMIKQMEEVKYDNNVLKMTMELKCD